MAIFSFHTEAKQMTPLGMPSLESGADFDEHGGVVPLDGVLREQLFKVKYSLVARVDDPFNPLSFRLS